MRGLVSVDEYDQGIVTENSDFTVSALRTIHPPLNDCFATNFVSDGQKICFSGDTAYMESLAGFAEGARILVHEAML